MGSAVSLAVAQGGNIPDTHALFLVLTGAEPGVYRSTDSGGHWTKLTLLDGAAARYVSLSPEYATDATLWVASASHGILRSADGGDTWQAPAAVLSNCGPVQVTGEGPGRQLWAACDGKLNTSTDGGVQWEISGPSNLAVATVATSPLLKTVFVGTDNGGGIWRGRPDTSTVVVMDEAGAPVAEAEVYRNGALAGRTAANGVLETPLAAGDQLVACVLLKTEPSKRGYHNPGGGANWAYRLYITSVAIPVTGEPAPAVVSNPQKIQYLTLRKDNTLIGFNLVASVEWDATAQFLEELRQGFALASRALYDASNGQMLFERVSIYDDNVALGSADVQIRTSSHVWPYASLAALLCRPERRVTGGFILTGRYFNGASSRVGAWNQQIAYSMLLHEFGHYGLEVHDSYYYFAPFPNKDSASCTGREIHHNQTPDINATLMDSLYATEFSMYNVPGVWRDLCLRTAQYQWDRRSDRETIVAVYQGTDAQWKLKTPADDGQVVAGPHVIPVAQWSRAEVAADAQSGACLTPPTLQVIRADGSPVPGSVVLLQRGSRLIEQGRTDGEGEITLLGAASGDWVTYEVLPPLLGAVNAAQTAFLEPRYIAREATACPASQVHAAGNSDQGAAATQVVVQPAAYDLHIQVTPSTPPNLQQAALRVMASTSLIAPPTVTWMQLGAESSVTPPLGYDPAAQAYVGSLTLASGLPAEGVLLVDAVDAQQRKVHTVVNLRLETVTPEVDQRIVSADGQAELSISANSLQGEGQISWQAQWVNAPAPVDLEMIAGPYELRISPSLTEVNPNPNLHAASLSLYYVERSASGEHIDLNSLQSRLGWAAVDSPGDERPLDRAPGDCARPSRQQGLCIVWALAVADIPSPDSAIAARECSIR